MWAGSVCGAAVCQVAVQLGFLLAPLAAFHVGEQVATEAIAVAAIAIVGGVLLEYGGDHATGRPLELLERRRILRAPLGDKGARGRNERGLAAVPDGLAGDDLRRKFRMQCTAGRGKHFGP